MSIELKIPELGENVTSGTVASVLVKQGDTIEKDQAIVELETEKAVLEVPASEGGVVQDVLIQAGDEVAVGQTVITLAGEGAATAKEPVVPAQAETPREELQPEASESPSQPAPVPQAQSAGGGIDVNVPELGENVEGGTVANVLVAVGDHIEKDQSIVELETEKAVLEVPSTAAGTVKEVLIKGGDEVKVGQTIILLESAEAAPAAPQPQEKPAAPEQPKVKAEAPKPSPQPEQTPPAPVSPPPAEKPGYRPAAASPSVRRFAREIGVDINQVTGTGPGQRITIEDVKAHSKKLHEQPRAAAATGVSVAAQPLPDFSKWGQVEREPMSKVRDKTAVHLSSAWATIPHVTQFDKADITRLEKLRKQHGAKVQEAGGKLTMTSIVLKVVASALKVFPQFNASVDMVNKEIVYKKYISIGIAVDTDRGLLVPVVRDVDKKNLTQLSVELSEIAAKARDRKLTLDDMQGGNFTISNLGGIGGTSFTPIINAPEVAILGISRGAFEQVYVEGEFVPRLMLPLSLSYDHRIIDGADGARFIRWIVEALQEPFTMILGG